MERKGIVTARVVTYIKNNIRSGSWTVGEKIPSENELCRELDRCRTQLALVADMERKWDEMQI